MISEPAGPPEFTRMDWTAFHVCLEGRYQGNPASNDEQAIDKCVTELTSAIQQATVTSAPKCLPGAHQQHHLPASI